ncbi:MAG: hypothetical protein JNL69_09540 [Bacteroidia bacterium]|nr:hypothetical protein [Bacteroidia bacterium]
MKKIFILILFINSYVYSQVVENTNCERPTFFCEDTTFNYASSQVTPCNDTYKNRWFYFEVLDSIETMFVQSNDSLLGGSIYGPFSSQLMNACPAHAGTVTSTFNINSSTPSTLIYNSVNGITAQGYEITAITSAFLPPGFYYVRFKTKACTNTISFSHKRGSYNCPSPACEDCIGSFAPNTEKKYMVSAWAKQEGAAPSVTNYSYPKLSVLSTSGSYSVSFYPSGAIIDGWQKIDGEFILPGSSTELSIKLECTYGNCFFDDIRVFPFDGSMKSYVYDPISLRLMAELDERNYATFYEYDEEGKLIRVKKETERGIMTIKENRNNSSK